MGIAACAPTEEQQEIDGFTLNCRYSVEATSAPPAGPEPSEAPTAANGVFSLTVTFADRRQSIGGDNFGLAYIHQVDGPSHPILNQLNGNLLEAYRTNTEIRISPDNEDRPGININRASYSLNIIGIDRSQDGWRDSYRDGECTREPFIPIPAARL